MMFDVLGEYIAGRLSSPFGLYHREGLPLGFDQPALEYPAYRLLQLNVWASALELRAELGDERWRLDTIYAVVGHQIALQRAAHCQFLLPQQTVQYYHCTKEGPSIWAYKFYEGTPAYFPPRTILASPT